MPLSLVSLLSRRHNVTELAPYEWSRSIFLLGKWGLCSPLPFGSGSRQVWCLIVGKPTETPYGR